MEEEESGYSRLIHTLSKWIRYNKKLPMELKAVGYNKFRRSFTPLEVRLLFKYLGEFRLLRPFPFKDC